MLIQNVSIGSDIEFFLKNKVTGEIVSAENIIQGTKYDPFHFDKRNRFFATSLDNVMAEGNIPPSNSPSEFYKNIAKLMRYISKTIPQELTLASLPSARLDEKWLQTDVARLFGCDPSYNCWTGEEEHPQAKEGMNVRSTGFHVHVGYEKPSFDANFDIAKSMDLHLGLPAVLIEPENERKTIGYGTAGNFRHQNHGMEYRSLSGFFSSSRELIEWCYNQAIAAIDFINSGRIKEILGLGDDIQRIINTENKKDAEKLCNQFGLQLV